VLLYVDEASFYLLPQLGITWAKRGHSPVLREGCRYQHLSAISAISPAGDLVYQIQESSFKGKDVVGFLKKLLDTLKQKLLIIWDGARIHSSKEVKDFLRKDKNETIYLAKIPPYSPELNADEQVWKTLKCDMLKNVVCKNLTQLKTKLQNAFQVLQQATKKIANFFKHPKVGFV
jgi:transposase